MAVLCMCTVRVFRCVSSEVMTMIHLYVSIRVSEDPVKSLLDHISLNS